MIGTDSPLDLPRDLGDGLTLRLAARADARALADFNARIHADGPSPDEGLRVWTIDLLGGDHPTAGPGDFTLVVDRAAGGKIVSSLGSIPQTWTYAGIPFPVGRPDLVGTDPDYRRRGLVAAQFEVIHALGARRGELLQGITGIPWYYRQFGYEMALELDCCRRLYWPRLPALKAGQSEAFRLRPATPDDIPRLQEMYQARAG
ncbi:MAG: GNAT family N-acetyltransferase [Chloroflexi bacterium]|nr:GNAT family N-acetyltransferase [Chloroflexota bacterium]